MILGCTVLYRILVYDLALAAIKEVCRVYDCFFFFQAEDGMRNIGRDWSSDVCSSDLRARRFSERFGGAVIFMDELDAVGSRGGVPQTMEPYPFDEPFRHGLEDRLVAGTREEPRQGGILGFVDRFFVGGMGGMGGMLVNELLVQMDGLEQPRGLRRFLRRLIPLKIKIGRAPCR